jgi:predicted ATPase
MSKHRLGPVCFFDRSIPDALCMLDQVAPLQQNTSRALVSRYPYRRLVFFPPWEDIYRNEAERDQTFAQAEAVFDTLITWYWRCGYEVVEVSPASISERCTFVLQMAGVGRT